LPNGFQVRTPAIDTQSRRLLSSNTEEMNPKHIEAYLAHLRERVEEHPDYADIRNNHGCVLTYLGRYPEALEAFDKALRINPRYVEAMICRCFVLAESGEADAAFSELKELHARSPHDMRVLLSLGIFCMRQEWKLAGLSMILRAAGSRSRLPFMLAYAAAAYLETDDRERSDQKVAEAREALHYVGLDPVMEESPKEFPDLDEYRKWENPYAAWRIHLLLANFFAEKGDFENANSEFLIVHHAYPGHIEALVGLGRTALAKGDEEAATTWFSRASAVDPDSHTALIHLGFISAETGRMEKALENFRKAVSLRPLFPDYRYHLGSALLEMGKPGEAIEQFEKALTLNPNYAAASLMLMKSYAAGDQPEKAVAAFEESPCGEWPEALFLAAKAHLKLDNRDEAARLLKRSLEIDPSHTETEELLDSIS